MSIKVTDDRQHPPNGECSVNTVGRFEMLPSHVPDLMLVMARLRSLMAREGSILIHVTAPRHCDHIAAVASQIALAASKGQPSRQPLLLLTDLSGDGIDNVLPSAPPELFQDFEARRSLSVARCGTEVSHFYVSALSGQDYRPIVEPLLRQHFTLVLVQCGPLLEEPFFTPVPSARPRVLMTLDTVATSIAAATRARQELAAIDIDVLGVITIRSKGRWDNTTTLGYPSDVQHGRYRDTPVRDCEVSQRRAESSSVASARSSVQSAV